ncbi:hypothetical protein ANN_25652 [Periplaneta americana]|uniref:Uncharacterized protein n=1 Tax=Periplaneta americana TaxID=6978 RepID=A0ABQ8S451_PERAM|nr:hypothetical protein ANN_25652 [Periplaneta americana]
MAGLCEGGNEPSGSLKAIYSVNSGQFRSLSQSSHISTEGVMTEATRDAISGILYCLNFSAWQLIAEKEEAALQQRGNEDPPTAASVSYLQSIALLGI